MCFRYFTDDYALVDVGFNGGVRERKVVGFFKRFSLDRVRVLLIKTFAVNNGGRLFLQVAFDCLVIRRTSTDIMMVLKMFPKEQKGYFRNIHNKIFPFFTKMYEKT